VQAWAEALAAQGVTKNCRNVRRGADRDVGARAKVELVVGAARYAVEIAMIGAAFRAGDGAGVDIAIAGVHPERDGCAVCPRCRAAWRFGGGAKPDEG
jgi:hypothetical protein